MERGEASGLRLSLEAESEKVRAMAVVQGAADAVIIGKLDRLTRSVKDLAELLERFNRHCGQPDVKMPKSE